jgi:hypothetical protein
MCRYAFKKYKETHACFKCQVGFKRPNLFDVQPETFDILIKKSKDFPNEAVEFRCPNCGGKTANLGRDLRLPTKTKDEQWRCIKYLYDTKYNIYSCGCQGIGFVPHKMEDAIQLVKDYHIRQKEYLKQQELVTKQIDLEAKRKKNANEVLTKKLLKEAKRDEKNN